MQPAFPPPIGQRRWALPLLPLLLVSLLAACSGAGSAKVPPGTRAQTSHVNFRGTPTPTPCTPVPDAIQQVEQSVVRIETFPDASGEISAGTGFVVDRDLVLTNAHVVADTVQRGVMRVITTPAAPGSQPVIGQILATNDAQDLALIQVNTGAIPPIVWGDDRTLSKGTPVAVIGYALDQRGPPLVSEGVYEETYVDASSGEAYLRSSVELQHGDSGGPLLNDCGQVVGVNTAKIRDEAAAGLAIPEYFAQRWTAEEIQSQR